MALPKRPKLSKEELKSPIAVQAKAQELWTYLEHHWKRVLIAAGSLIVLGLIIVIVQSWRTSRAEAAAMLFGRGLETALTPLAGDPEAPDPAKRPSIPGHEPIPVFNEPAARANAALGVFQQVKEKYSGDLADLALLASADMHYDVGAWDAAIADYLAFLASEPTNGTIRGLTLEALGGAYENKGDVENARLTYEKLGSEIPENALLPDRRLYHLGRLAARTGDGAKAREYFNKLKTDFPASPLVVEVNTRLTLLDNPGLMAAAPVPPGPAGTGTPVPMTAGPAPVVPLAPLTGGAELPPAATAAPAPATAVPPAATAAPAAPPATGAAG